MPRPSALARVLVAVDLSPETTAALACAESLRAARPTAIDVYYLWSQDPALSADAGDHAIAAIESFARTRGAWDRLDHLNALERRRVIRVPGWMTRAWRGGGSLAEIAARQGYDLVVVGLARPPASWHRFDLHTIVASGAVTTTPAKSGPRLAGRLL